MDTSADHLGANDTKRRFSLSRALRLLGAVSVALAAVIVTAAPVAAFGTPLSCTARTEMQAFKNFGDYNSYFRVSNGGFESSTSDWLLSGGANVVPNNEPWKVAALTDAYSLQIPNGGTAESRTICVGLGEDTIRLFAYNSRVSGAILHVEAIVRNPTNGWIAQTAFDVNADASPYGWYPTIQLGIPNMLGGTGGTTQELTLRFSTRGTAATWRIDDVFVDPVKSF